MEQKALALRASLDPLWAAQQRFNMEMAEARTLISSGVISLDEYVAKLRMEQAALDADLAWLQETLEGLGEDLRETAILVIGEGLTHAEAGEILGIGESTVSWRMHKLKGQLKEIAEQQA